MVSFGLKICHSKVRLQNITGQNWIVTLLLPHNMPGLCLSNQSIQNFCKQLLTLFGQCLVLGSPCYILVYLWFPNTANKNSAENFLVSFSELASGSFEVTDLNLKPMTKAVIFVLSRKYR